MPSEPHNPWSTERLDDAFATARRDIEGLKQDLRTLEPLVGDVSGLHATVTAVQKDVSDVEVAVAKYVNKSVTRQLIIVSTPLFLGTITVIAAILAGVKPG